MGINKVQDLHSELMNVLNTVPLGVAGRILYFDEENQLFILAMHATSPEKTLEATNLAFEHIYGTEDNRSELGVKLQKANIGFAGKQI